MHKAPGGNKHHKDDVPSRSTTIGYCPLWFPRKHGVKQLAPLLCQKNIAVPVDLKDKSWFMRNEPIGVFGSPESSQVFLSLERIA
jgi:hypothetical protein